MIHITSGVGLVLEVGLAVFCFVDVLMNREGTVRHLPRWAWALAILVFPLAGCIAYLVASRRPTALARAAGAAGRADGQEVPPAWSGGTPAGPPGGRGAPADPPYASGQSGAADGRPRSTGRDTARPGRRPAASGPGDEAGLLLELSRLNDEHEAMLRRWEADLRAREARLRAAPGAGTGPDDRGLEGDDRRPEVAA